MQFPLSFWDISLVLAVVSIVLLAMSELVSSYRGRNLAIEKKVLRMSAVVFCFAFLLTVIVKVYQIILVASA